MRVAAVGHVEWVEFAEVERVPRQGEIIEARRAWFDPGGSGAVAGVQLARLAGGHALFFTSLGDDELGHRSKERLEELGLTVHVAWRDEPTRRGYTYVDDDGERTITVVGRRLAPRGDDELPWEELKGMDAVYFTAGDAGAVRASRAAATLTATMRVLPVLREAAVELDAIAGSGSDPKEQYEPGMLEPAPRWVVRTAGSRGGEWVGAEGRSGAWQAAELPGPVADAYGCGDSFAAGLTFGLGAGRSINDALELGARCGACCLTGHGPYERQLRDPG